MAELGFASISIGDRHITCDYYLQVLPTMCRLSAHFGDMQLIPLFLLPFYHPILLAEQVAMLDVMSSGRTTMICCLGHQPEAYEALRRRRYVCHVLSRRLKSCVACVPKTTCYTTGG
jgi:alkanesulfonate monooxygenase SsuD/methylene tetrahydromethanopterin reductase-like flavin-dependent oxidoreductase (luciferase family)